MKLQNVSELIDKHMRFKLRLAVLLIFTVFSTSTVSGITITTLSDGSSEKILTFTSAEDQVVFLRIPSSHSHVLSAHLDLSGIYKDFTFVFVTSDNGYVSCMQGGSYADFIIPQDHFQDATAKNISVSISSTRDQVWEVKLDGQMIGIIDEACPDPNPCRKSAFNSSIFNLTEGRLSFTLLRTTDYNPCQGTSNSLGDFLGGTPVVDGTWHHYMHVRVSMENSSSNYPRNPFLEVGTPDGIYEWNYAGEFDQNDTSTNDFSSAINSYLLTCSAEANGYCEVPLLFHSDTAGIIKISNINISVHEPVIYYVDNDAPDDPEPNNPDIGDPNEDGSPEHPFDSIQEAINVAIDGDTIIVIDGTYYENINFNGKNIILTSAEPSNSTVLANTIIDGSNSRHTVVTFSGSEDPNCVLTGFTITNGNAYLQGGGIDGNGTKAMITNCIISNNYTRNSRGGGGLHRCNGTITNCTISGNSTTGAGGGLSYCDGTITSCSISGNSARGGGGICNCGSLTNCTISSNSADHGGGIYGVSCQLITITNCILWENIATDGNEIAMYSHNSTSTIEINYCDVRDGLVGISTGVGGIVNWGIGNIDATPYFVDPNNGDYHLRPDSPCIDAGDPNYMAGPNETDLDGNPRVVGGRIDMGAYESSYLPDLAITSEDITFVPIPGEPCSPATISATIWNTGEAKAENVKVVFYDFDEIIGDVNIPSIQPSDSNTVSIQHTWDTNSFRLVTITVDPDIGQSRGGPVRHRGGRIRESDETNNTASKVYQIGNPADANAILDVSWNSAPACYIEDTSAVVQGKADYRIEIRGADDIVSPALGSIVTAQIIDSNGVVTNLQRTLTGPDGYFYIPFIVPDANYGSFTIEISVTDCTLTGTLEKLFCIQPYIHPPKKDLWICDLTVSDETPDIGDVVTVCATVCASPDNNDETLVDIPVTFYAYPPSGGAYQIGSSIIPQLNRGESETVCVNWTPTVNGLHRIEVVIGISDDNLGNNYSYYSVVVGMFNVTANPRWVVLSQQVQITVDSREPLPSNQLDSISVLDSGGQPITVWPADPCHPLPTRWIYQTSPLPAGTALGTAAITVTGTDSRGVQYTCQGYFEVYEIMPNFWLNSCDINFSNLNPALGEPITIDAIVHAGFANPKPISNIPVTFYSKHLPSNGDYIKIGQTQYTGEILPGGVSAPVFVSWQNAAKGEYEIKASLEPGFSDAYNGDNAATRALLVGTGIPFEAVFEVVNRTRTGRTTFEYECNVRLYNQTGLILENVQLELTGVSSNMTLVAPYTANFAYIGPKGSALSENICTFIVDRSQEIDTAQITWHLTYQIKDICGIMQQISSTFVQLEPESIVPGDIKRDGKVNLDDLKMLVDQWLQPPGTPSADIAPTPPDGIVNLYDYAVLAEHWLEGF